jgi:hypothetical protein
VSAVKVGVRRYTVCVPGPERASIVVALDR